MSSGVIAMQVNAACWLQQAAHLQQPDGHHNQVRLHTLAVSQPRSVYYLVQRRLGFRYLPVPRQVNVIQCPGVLEGSAGRRASYGRGRSSGWS